MTIQVLLADDHPIVREGMRALLERQGLAVIGEVSDGREAVVLVQKIFELDHVQPLKLNCAIECFCAFWMRFAAP